MYSNLQHDRNEEIYLTANMTEIFLILSQYFILCTPSAKRLSQFFQGNYNESSTSRTAAMHLQTLLV